MIPPPVRSTAVTPPAPRQPLHKQRTFPGAAAAASLGGDELPAQLGQTGLQQPQVVGGGLVLLRPGHLKGHRTEGSHREGSAALGPGATPAARAPSPLHRATLPGPSPASAPLGAPCPGRPVPREAEGGGAVPPPQSPRSWPGCRSWCPRARPSRPPLSAAAPRAPTAAAHARAHISREAAGGKGRAARAGGFARCPEGRARAASQKERATL